MHFILVLLYLWAGQVTLEQKPYKSQAECAIAAAKRVEEIQKDPRFDGGFGAWCVPVQENDGKRSSL